MVTVHTVEGQKYYHATLSPPLRAINILPEENTRYASRLNSKCSFVTG